MHITSFDIFTVGNLLNIFMEHDLNILMIFGMKKKDNFDPYNVLLAIATNIPVLLMTFVLQGHISHHMTPFGKGLGNEFEFEH